MPGPRSVCRRSHFAQYPFRVRKLVPAELLERREAPGEGLLAAIAVGWRLAPN